MMIGLISLSFLLLKSARGVRAAARKGTDGNSAFFFLYPVGMRRGGKRFNILQITKPEF